MNHLLRFPLEKMRTVVDLGAGNGNTANFMARRIAKGGLVYAVEPQISLFLDLARSHDKNVVPICLCISDRIQQVRMFLAKQRYASSIVNHKSNVTQKVLCVKWDLFVELLGLEKVDLAKVDIEGAEYLLLKGMSKVFPKRIIMEYHRLPKDSIPMVKALNEKKYNIVGHDHPYLFAERR